MNIIVELNRVKSVADLRQIQGMGYTLDMLLSDTSDVPNIEASVSFDMATGRVSFSSVDMADFKWAGELIDIAGAFIKLCYVTYGYDEEIVVHPTRHVAKKVSAVMVTEDTPDYYLNIRGFFNGYPDKPGFYSVSITLRPKELEHESEADEKPVATETAEKPKSGLSEEQKAKLRAVSAAAAKKKAEKR